MAEGIMAENQPKAAITVSRMCSLLSMSRSQFYWHVKRGTFHEPLRLSNGRPYFNASQVEDNLRARKLGVGVNGEYVLFYERDSETSSATRPTSKRDNGELRESLATLGLGELTASQVDRAVEACFPQGMDGQDEDAILRTVFRHLKRAKSSG